LIAAIKAAVSAKAPAKGPIKKGKRKGRKEGDEVEIAAVQQAAAAVAEQEEASWGPLEPLHQILRPIIALVRLFITSQTVIAVLFALLMYAWLVPPRSGGSGIGYPGYTSPQRLAAYEEIWRKEESELWDWLEDRVGVENLYAPGRGQQDRQRVRQAKSMGKKLEDERMSQRQMDDAIRVTEERLAALKDAVGKKKGGAEKGGPVNQEL
jgi:hypothetical protein